MIGPGWARLCAVRRCSLVAPEQAFRPLLAAQSDRTQDILVTVAKTSVEIDRDIARQAAAILGTTTLRDTIDASLREIVHARRRLELVAMLTQEGRFDFEAAEHAWGADD